MIDLVRDDIDRMHALCRDPERNEPVARTAFAMTEDLGHCRTCNYRELRARTAA